MLNAIVLVFVVLLLGLLVFQNRALRQRGTELKTSLSRIERTSENDRLVSKWIRRLLNSPLEERELSINYLLEVVRAHLDCDRSAMFELSDDASRLSLSYERCGEGIGPTAGQEADLDTRRFTWLEHQLNDSSALVIEDRDRLPEDAAAEREEMIRWGIRSMIIVPLQESGKPIGFLTFEVVERDMAWDALELELLEVMADALSSVIMRWRAEERAINAREETWELLNKAEDTRRSLLSILEDQRLSEIALRESESHLKDAQALAALGSWHLDLLGDRLYWSEVVYEIFEIEPNRFNASYEAFLETVHPDDREMVNSRYLESLRDKTDYAIEHRLLFADGRVKFVSERGRHEYDTDGKPVASIGTVQDITERREHELYVEHQVSRTRALLEIPRLAESHDEQGFLQETLKFAEDLTDSRISFAHFVHADEGEIELVAWSAATLAGYCEVVTDRHYPVKDAGIWADAVRNRAPVVFNDYENYQDKHGLPDGHASLSRLISLPVLDNDRVVALFGVGNRSTDYGEQEIETLQLIGNTAWRNVQRVRLRNALVANESRYRELIRFMSDGVCVFEPVDQGRDYVFTEWNDAAAKITGRVREDVLGESIRTVFTAAEDMGMIRILQKISRTRTPEFLAEHRYSDASLTLWMESYIYPLDSGELVVVFSDISARKHAQERQRLAEKVFESTVEGVTVTDLEGQILYVNPAFETITGYSQEEAVGQNPRILKSGRHDESFYREFWDTIAQNGVWQGEVWNRRKDGEVYPEWLTVNTVHNEEGRPENYVAVFNDLTSLKEAENKLDYLAYHDALTNLPNLSLFRDRLAHAISRAQLKDHSLALLIIDLDRFKTVNDTLGLSVGDELLMRTSERILAQTDVGDTLARRGGDEFMLLLEDVESLQALTAWVQALQANLARPDTIQGHELTLTASTGISMYPEDGRDAETLIQHAERAMYEAKRQGRNTYQFFTKSLSDGAFETLVMENALRGAVSRSELILHYQPQLSLADGSLRGVESLVRWNHPELGMIPPGRFIRLAEELGIIDEIGDWVLTEACRQLVAWDKAGFYVPRVAVNLSVRQIERVSLSAMVNNALEWTGLTPDRLELEVTESILMSDPEASKEALMALENSGVELAIDDFGTGYSSLSYLRLLPIDRLKIDQSFVAEIGRDPNGEAIVKAIIALALSLKLGTVAEGVENETQADFLRAEGAEVAQGYLYGRPVPADELMAYWLSR